MEKPSSAKSKGSSPSRRSASPPKSAGSGKGKKSPSPSRKKGSSPNRKSSAGELKVRNMITHKPVLHSPMY